MGTLEPIEEDILKIEDEVFDKEKIKEKALEASLTIYNNLLKDFGEPANEDGKEGFNLSREGFLTVQTIIGLIVSRWLDAIVTTDGRRQATILAGTIVDLMKETIEA